MLSGCRFFSKNGKTGSRVNQRLQDLGYATRPVSRSTNPSFDWNNPQTWQSAIKGTRAAYVTYHPDLALPHAEAAIKEFVQVARENALEHIVLLSGRGEDGAQRAENILKECGVKKNTTPISISTKGKPVDIHLDLSFILFIK